MVGSFLLLPAIRRRHDSRTLEPTHMSMNPQQELIHSILGVDLTAIKRLLGAGADPNRDDDAETSPMACAVRSGHLYICKTLINHGGDVLRPDARGRRPIDETSDAEFAKMLILPNRNGRRLIEAIDADNDGHEDWR